MNVLKKYRDFFVYIVFGFQATILNALLYMIFYQKFMISNVISTIIAWTITLVFAFFTNKFFVYKSTERRVKYIFVEFINFFLCRLLSGVLDVIFMFISVDLLNLLPLLMKFIAALGVGLINYFGGKLFIFKSR
ncbi:GtrA family protein [Bullifex sp.]|uniref:GtrA family protein n=1 Tax=Bullifex sp. TaxID=2815808 RepID=UPI002A832293|nr:GtrA family protein [Bullifex sp.]MDY4066144.1 GtrA family protein [Bullifex sp.]